MYVYKILEVQTNVQWPKADRRLYRHKEGKEGLKEGAMENPGAQRISYFLF